MILKKGGVIVDWVTPEHVAILKLETPAEHLARVHEQFLERKLAMGKRYLLHPANQVKRLDGKVYAASTANDNVRPLPRKQRQAA